jgi:hypothetical protein
MTKTNDTKLTIPHLPEPWTYNFARPYGIVDIIASDPTGEYPRGLYVAEIDTDDVGRYTSHEQHEANARRIVAAVNACNGFGTEALEQGVVGELLEALKGCLFALDKNLDGYGPSKAQAIATATATIAKATGRAA